MRDFSKLEALVLPAIVVLVGLSAFGLGRLSAGAGALASGAPPSAKATQGTYVASKSGSRYYLPDCPGVANIKDSNRVWFNSAAQAAAQGYTPAANCPGL